VAWTLSTACVISVFVCMCVCVYGSEYVYPCDNSTAKKQAFNGLISRFLSRTCTEVSGVENIGQCGRLSWLLGAL